MRSKGKFDHSIGSQAEWHSFGIIIVIMSRVLKYVENRTLQSNKILLQYFEHWYIPFPRLFFYVILVRKINHFFTVQLNSFISAQFIYYNAPVFLYIQLLISGDLVGLHETLEYHYFLSIRKYWKHVT